MESGLTQAIDNANQMNNMTMWIVFTFLVIAPLGIALIYIPVALIEQRRNLKCPNCGSWRRNKSKMQMVATSNDGKTVMQKERHVTCAKCKNEFTT